MKTIMNRKALMKRRKKLRNNATKAERILWKYLKHSKLNGFKFRRQQSIGNYIVDFYCPRVRLEIELDGIQHSWPENVKADKKRTEYLNSLGVTVVRFWNWEVENDVNDVLHRITFHLQ
jgi:very-short-patch-repair endonuclease